MLMRIGYADPPYVGCAYGMAIRWTGIYWLVGGGFVSITRKPLYPGGRAVIGGTDSGTRSEVPRRHVPSTGPFMLTLWRSEECGGCHRRRDRTGNAKVGRSRCRRVTGSVASM